MARGHGACFFSEIERDRLDVESAGLGPGMSQQIFNDIGQLVALLDYQIEQSGVSSSRLPVAVSRIMEVRPITPVKGVRSSCDTDAINRSLETRSASSCSLRK